MSGNGGPVAVDGQIIAPAGTAAQWLDDDRVIYNGGHPGDRWTTDIFDLRTGEVTEADPRGCNELAAGGGRWIAWLAGVGLFGAFNEPAAGVSPTGTDGRGAAGRDGTLAIVPNRQAGAEVILYGPSGETTRIAPAVYGLQVLGPAQAIWNGGALGVTLPRLLPGAVNARRVVAPDGVAWWIYWSDARGLVAHPEGSLRGHIIEPQPRAFHHDAVIVDGRLVVAYSTGPGEMPGEIVTVPNVWALPAVSLEAPVIIPPTKPPVIVPPVTPPIGGTVPDFDRSLARIVNSPPDLMQWQQLQLRVVDIRADGIHIEFDGMNDLPDVVPAGWSGPLLYTIGLGAFRNGAWVLSAVIQCWRGLDVAGGPVLDGGHIARNWFYSDRWGDLFQYQPAVGEGVAIFAAAGNCRDVNIGRPSGARHESARKRKPTPYRENHAEDYFTALERRSNGLWKESAGELAREGWPDNAVFKCTTIGVIKWPAAPRRFTFDGVVVPPPVDPPPVDPPPTDPPPTDPPPTDPPPTSPGIMEALGTIIGLQQQQIDQLTQQNVALKAAVDQIKELSTGKGIKIHF